jgi:hypothetical protein
VRQQGEITLVWTLPYTHVHNNSPTYSYTLIQHLHSLLSRRYSLAHTQSNTQYSHLHSHTHSLSGCQLVVKRSDAEHGTSPSMVEENRLCLKRMINQSFSWKAPSSARAPADRINNSIVEGHEVIRTNKFHFISLSVVSPGSEAMEGVASDRQTSRGHSGLVCSRTLTDCSWELERHKSYPRRL